MGKHIVVISQYFYPEQFRINDLCNEWMKRGYKVTVVTGIPNYPEGKFYQGYGWFHNRRENYNNIEIIRIPIIPRGHSSLKLILNYISFVISGYLWKLFTRLKADCVFIYEVSPMTQALPGIWYAKKHKLPCYLYVQDLWPENVVIITGITNKYFIGVITKLVKYIYSKCTAIFCTSVSFVTAIHRRGVELEKIKFWPQYAEDYCLPLERKSIPEIPQDGTFHITFTGNIGEAQGLSIAVETAILLRRQHPDMKLMFHIVGDGRYKDTLIQIVKENNLTHMFHFIPKQPATRIPEILAASDAALICLADNPLFSMTIPAKFQTYLACGIPIIASAEGEINRMISSANIGFANSAGDAPKLAASIIEFMEMPECERKQMGINARLYYEKYFNKEDLLNFMDQYLDN